MSFSAEMVKIQEGCLSGVIWDYYSLSIASETETHTFKIGGASGETVAILVIVYTSSARTDILTVTRTL